MACPPRINRQRRLKIEWKKEKSSERKINYFREKVKRRNVETHREIETQNIYETRYNIFLSAHNFIKLHLTFSREKFIFSMKRTFFFSLSSFFLWLHCDDMLQFSLYPNLPEKKYVWTIEQHHLIIQEKIK